MSAPAELLRLLAAGAGLLLPGAGWALAARWPLPWLAGGVLSALTLLAGFLLAGLAGWAPGFAALSCWLVAGGLPGWVWWWRQADRRPVWTGRIPPGAWLALPVLPGLAVVAWRALAQPLSGPDVGFRWDLLAGLLAEPGGFATYPPVSTEDFTRYFWPDAIAPLVGSLYAWVYLAAGGLERTWTALPVLLQVGGLGVLLFQLGRHWGGNRGGWFACALGGATLLLQFAVNLGQETGLTALGAVGMIFYLLPDEDSRDSRAWVPAALCAALAACAREYGAVAAVAGVLWLAGRRVGWRRIAGFVVIAALLPAVWHGRVWLRTGNPLFPVSLGLFPTNPVFEAWMQGYQAIYGATLRSASGWLELGRLVLVSALPVAGGLAAAVVWFRSRPGAALAGLTVAGFGAMWLASVPYTAGGLFYSMRVLSPVCVLGCAWGGAALARAVPGERYLAGVMAGLALLAVDASLRAWTLPANPYALPATAWASAGDQIRQDFERQDAPFIAAAVRAAEGRVLTDTAGLRRFFVPAGKTCSPFWSPDVAWLFTGKPVPGAAARLRALGYSHVLLKRASFSLDFLARTGAQQSLEGQWKVVMANPSFLLLELAPAPAAEPRHE